MAPASNATSGIHSQNWTLQDGTKVTSKFTIEKNIAVVPLDPSAQERKIKVEDRNAQAASDDSWDCVTKETRITLSNSDYLTVDNLAQSANIYPGAIYRFSNYVNGSWLAETGDRNPITLSTPTRRVEGESYVIVDQPDKNTIRAGVNTLTNRFPNDPADLSNGAFKMEATEVLSLADANLKLGASGYGFGASASYLFNFTTSEKKKFFLVDCTQELFILDTEVPSGGFFASPRPLASDMMYVGSVTYGVRVLASIETVISSSEISHKFDAAYDGLVAGGSVSLDAYMRELGSNTTVKMYVIGGPQQGVYPAFNQAELIQVIQGIFQHGTYASAQPIKYNFRNMKGELVISQSLTDYFISRSCTPKEPVESKPDRIYSTKLWRVSRGEDDDDWEIYGQIWTQVFDAQGNEIGSQYGNDRLMAINEENHLSAQEGVGGYSPELEVTFRLPASIQPGAVMLIWYWLNDYDSGSGNDFLSMRNGREIRYNQNGLNYFCRLIYLDELAPGQNSQKIFEDTFTDEGGDSFTSVTGSVNCVVAQ